MGAGGGALSCSGCLTRREVERPGGGGGSEGDKSLLLAAVESQCWSLVGCSTWRVGPWTRLLRLVALPVLAAAGGENGDLLCEGLLLDPGNLQGAGAEGLAPAGILEGAERVTGFPAPELLCGLVSLLWEVPAGVPVGVTAGACREASRAEGAESMVLAL